MALMVAAAFFSTFHLSQELSVIAFIGLIAFSVLPLVRTVPIICVRRTVFAATLSAPATVMFGLRDGLLGLTLLAIQSCVLIMTAISPRWQKTCSLLQLTVTLNISVTAFWGFGFAAPIPWPTQVGLNSLLLLIPNIAVMNWFDLIALDLVI